MEQAESEFVLPGRIDRLLGAAARFFSAHANEEIARLLTNGRLEIVEGEDYDNWNGGQHGHGVRILLNEHLYALCEENLQTYESEVCKYLNKISHAENEHISNVSFALDIDAIPGNWREQSDLLLSPPSLATADEAELVHLWGGGSPRVFLSHKAEYKAEATRLKEELKKYGIASFVAHEDIVPTRTWQAEIERALGSMSVMIAFVSEGFSQSDWTNQEVGVALGRGIPIVAVRINEDPPGFLAHRQAVRVKSGDPQPLARALLSVLCAEKSISSSFLNALVDRWENASSHREAAGLMYALQELKSMPSELLARIETAYAANDQLQGSYVVQQHVNEFITRMRSTSQ